jgi:hypothetical protein
MKSAAKQALSEKELTVVKDKSFNEKTGNRNLDLNDILARIKEQKNKDKKINLLVLSSILAIAIIIFLILGI